MISIFFEPPGYLPLKLMKVKGAIHIGAHEAEELDHYVSCGVKKTLFSIDILFFFNICELIIL